MSIYDSKLWIEDIDRILTLNPWISTLSGKSVVVTGIGGLICSAVADILIRYNETHDDQVTIIAAARSEERIKHRFGEFSDRRYFKFVEYDATQSETHISLDSDYIIHGAGNASPNMIVKEPVETMLGNLAGLYSLLEYAKEKTVKRLLFISSSEVYGKKEGNNPFTINQYGYVDLLNPRNSYAVAKRAAETMCIAFAEEYGVETVIIRPGHIYGPTAGVMDCRVSSKWAYDVANGKSIVMKSDGSQLRSYCHCLDSASAILKVLISGENKHAYNISTPGSVISIKEMAKILASCAGVELDIVLPSEKEKKEFNPMTNSSLDGSGLIDLGWKGYFDPETGFDHTVRILKETKC